MNVAVIGAGNGGQALAAWISNCGHNVKIYDRNESRVKQLKKKGFIELVGEANFRGFFAKISTKIDEIVFDADLIMVATTAIAHNSIALQIAPYLKDNQIIVLNPGRTGGALEFRNTLNKVGISKKIFIAEAQTLVFACRLIENGKVNIIGIKEKVLISALPSSDTSIVIKTLELFFKCFYPAKNVLETSFENIGAIFHPCVVLFNEAAIERGDQFYFYRDMTSGLARLIEQADNERLAVAKAYGYSPISAKDWVADAYVGVCGDTLCERMQNNPAYYDILAPKTINCRQITEDIPTGILPLSELGKVAGVPTPIFDALITICSFLLDQNFRKEGRSLINLGLDNDSVKITEVVET